jgi:hypothetical protein
MAAKLKAILTDGIWRVLKTNAKGEETTDDVIAEVEGMSAVAAVKAYQGFVGDAPNKRRAAVSLLCHIIIMAQQDGKKLEKHKGAGDKTVGQLKQSFKDDFTKAEDAFFDSCRAEDNPSHKAFLSALPKLTERGEPIEKDGKPDMDERFAYFLKGLRKDNTYATNKNLVLNFWHFVGQDPFTFGQDDSLHIIPPEAMRVMVNNAKDVKPADNSWEARVIGVCRELYLPDDPKDPVLLLDDKKRAEVITSLELALQEAQRQDKLAKGRDKATDAATAAMEVTKRAATPPGEAAIVKKQEKTEA